MTSKVSAVALSLVLSLAWATAGSAQVMERHSLSGGVQYQIGDGLPIPILGAAGAVADATVKMPTAGTANRTVQLSASQMTHPGTPFNLPVFNTNPNVFQVRTAITIQFPQVGASFKVGGRTGAPTVRWCPGVIVGSGTGGCLTPGAGPSINGKITYTATGAQFGGPGRGATGGAADVALRVSAGPGSATACNYATNPGCQVIFALATPAGTGAQGGRFNALVSTTGAAPATGLYNAVIQPGGVITFVTPTGLGPGLPNPATSFGAPWTTGMMSLTNTAAFGSNETFTLQGTMSRTAGGQGTISLVSGAMSDRTLSGPNANRGWLTMVIGAPIEDLPALGTWGIAALAVVLAGGAARRLRKRA